MSDQKNPIVQIIVYKVSNILLLYDMTYNASCEKNSMSERRIYV